MFKQQATIAAGKIALQEPLQNGIPPSVIIGHSEISLEMGQGLGLGVERLAVDKLHLFRLYFWKG